MDVEPQSTRAVWLKLRLGMWVGDERGCSEMLRAWQGLVSGAPTGHIQSKSVFTLEQKSQTFLTPGPTCMEDRFPTDQE